MAAIASLIGLISEEVSDWDDIAHARPFIINTQFGNLLYGNLLYGNLHTAIHNVASYRALLLLLQQKPKPTYLYHKPETYIPGGGAATDFRNKLLGTLCHFRAFPDTA